MGSTIEINDTLLLTSEQGFPETLLNFERHHNQGISSEEVANQIFSFQKDGVRLFHLDPVRVFLVQKIHGKWLFWGNALIQSQTISRPPGYMRGKDENPWITSGRFIIAKLYDAETQRVFTEHESPSGKSFFER